MGGLPRGVFVAGVAMPWLFTVLSCAAAPGAQLVQLRDSAPTPLTAVFDCRRQLDRAAVDPDTAWQASGGGNCEALETRQGFVTIGRARLAARATPFVLQFASTRTDRVVVRTRAPGDAWMQSQAGDRVALAEWPIFGQAPAFALPAGDALDVIVELRNAATGSVEAVAWPHALYDRHRILQANLSGIVGGLGLMCVIVSLISALSHNTRSAWLGLAYAFCTALVVFAFNGFGAIWLYPAHPWLNDFLKTALPILTATLLYWSILREVDHLPPGKWRDASVGLLLAMALTAIAWASQEGSAGSRRPLVAAYVGVASAASLALCATSGLRGGRYAVHLAVATLLFVSATALAFVPGNPSHSLDLPSALAGSLLFASVLAVRHTRLQRLRFGRDVLGVQARAQLRDSLTGLLSYRGLHRAYDAVRLRQKAAVGEELAALAVALCAAERTGETLGFEMNDELRVQIASVLHACLDDRWRIGRLGPGHFAAVASIPITERESVERWASRILAACARLGDTVDVVAELDLRIAWAAGASPRLELSEIVRQLDARAKTLPAGKRIAKAAQVA